jgi:murein L,D-transpeptidase YcbB/YkuD
MHLVRREALIGVGLAGALSGALVATLTGGPAQGHSPGGVGEAVQVAAAQALESNDRLVPEAAGAAPDPLRDLVSSLGTLHASLQAGAVGSTKGTTSVVVEEIGKYGTFARVLQLFFEQTGTGTFIAGGKLTPLGREVAEWIGKVEAEGLDPAPYGLPELAAAVEPFAKGEASAALTPPEELGEAGPILVRALRAPVFDAEDVRQKLAATGVVPTPEQAQALAQQVAAAKSAESAGDDLARLEVRLGRALLQLVLDYRFVRRAGPFDPSTAEGLMEMKKTPGRIVDAMTTLADAQDAAEAFDRELAPRHPSYGRTVEAFLTYQKYAKAECPQLPPTWKLRQGMQGDEVKVLQKRLACEGYFAGPVDGVFAEALLAAVQAYQRHHDLNDEGFLGEESIASLNVPLAKRVEQIRLALHHLRESKTREAGKLYMRINIPAFEMQVIDQGQVMSRHPVIIGTNKLDDDKVRLVQGHINRTKLFRTRLYEVIVHPSWILPKRVTEGELKGQLEKDPKYLEKQNIHQVTLPDGKQVLVQGFGEGNVLGKVKFLLEESQAVFMHDTDDRSLFKHRRRDLSHGCIRVERAVELAEWVLRHDGEPEREINKAFRLDQYQRGFKLSQPIDVVTEYVTVEVSEEGTPVFYADVYGYDQAYFAGQLPPATEMLWGSATLRPSWVPYVPKETVQQWAAEGRPAPRDYDPKRHGGG